MKDKYELLSLLAAALLFIVIGFAFGGLVNSLLNQGYLQKESVKAGHAEYYLDKDNNRQWRWLPPCAAPSK